MKTGSLKNNLTRMKPNYLRISKTNLKSKVKETIKLKAKET
jgi:hypothetical protein